MDYKKLSRRTFFEKSLSLAVLPVPFLAHHPLAMKNSSFAFSALQQAEVPDKTRLKALLDEKGNRLIWLFTGDSITHGAKHTHGYRSYPEIFAERIRWELRRSRDVIINTGISGNTTQTILEDFDWRIRQFKPNVVSLMIGTNDCAPKRVPIEKFEENLHLLVTNIRNLDAIPILQTPNIIITEKDASRSRLPDYALVIRKVAASDKVVLIDNYRFWLESFENHLGVTVYKKWLNDPLHPDGDGHSQIARLMFRELSIFDPQAPTCGAGYYEGLH